jgi:hypothetical protein
MDRSSRARLLAGVGALALAVATASAAAEAPGPVKRPSPTPSTAAIVSEVVVTAAPRGAVVGDVQPELSLTSEEIAAQGVSSVTDLLAALAPQVRSDRGRGAGGPVVLLNGHRTSGFQELRDIPPEAIQRVDLLPEEAALKYGYSADQRVINFVLKTTFRAETAEASGGVSTAGGGAAESAELGVTRIINANPMNLNLRYSRQDSILESDRNLTSLAPALPFDIAGNVQSRVPGSEIDPALSALSGRTVTVAGVPAAVAGRPLVVADFVATANTPNVTDVRPYRTLVPQTDKLTFNGAYSRDISPSLKATFNATFEASDSQSLRGLPGVSLVVPTGNPFSPFARDVAVERYVPIFGALGSQNQTWTGHLGGGLNKDLAGGAWRLSLTGAYDHGATRTEIDQGVDASALQAALTAGSSTADPFGPLPANLLAQRAHGASRSISDTGNLQLVASGPMFAIPAGNVRASFKIGASGSRLSSESQNLGVTRQVDLSRNGANLQGNLDVPLASKRNDVFGFLGDVTANANASFDQLSDFGSLTSFGYGLNWRPLTSLSLLLSHTHDQGAPTQAQLGNPVVLTPGVRIFDYKTGQTVDVTQVGGGNPALTGDNRDVTSARVTYRPFETQQLIFNAEYIDSHTKNPITSFPAATSDIEVAFPDRFVRNAQGVLTQIDYRPVNFASQDRKQLRWGFNYSRPIGPAPAPPQRPAAPGSTPGARGPGPRPADGKAPAGATPGAKPTGAAPAMTAAPAADAPRAPRFMGPPGGFPGGGFGGGGFGGGGPPGGFGGRGSLNVSLYHTVVFENRYRVRPGVAPIDLLNGGALGATGGQPRHEVEANVGLAERGYGAQLAADWKSGTTVRGGTTATGDLAFSSIATINLRLFADLSQRKTLVEKAPFLNGSRLTLSLNNLFDQRIQVRDGTGATPVNYQPDYVDPTGRTLRIGFRKLFH